MTDRRWTCPNNPTSCDQPGRLAPERAHDDDTRTYCLVCSERTGRLVRRVCQVVEKKRNAKAEREERERAARNLKREREREERARLRPQVQKENAERAKQEREAARVATEQNSIRNANVIATGESIRTGYYYVHNASGSIRQVPPHESQRALWERRKHPPAFAQIAATLYSALLWFPSATDPARTSTSNGLKRIDATAPGLFPLGAHQYLETLERASPDRRATGSLYNWTAIVDALEKDAKRERRSRIEQVDSETMIVGIDPGSPSSGHAVVPGPPHVTATVVTDPLLADLVRTELLERLRNGLKLYHPIADEIECAPAAFRGH